MGKFKVGDKCVIIPGHGIAERYITDFKDKIVTIVEDSTRELKYDYHIEPRNGFNYGIKEGNLRLITPLEELL